MERSGEGRAHSLTLYPGRVRRGHGAPPPKLNHCNTAKAGLPQTAPVASPQTSKYVIPLYCDAGWKPLCLPLNLSLPQTVAWAFGVNGNCRTSVLQVTHARVLYQQPPGSLLWSSQIHKKILASSHTRFPLQINVIMHSARLGF